MPPIWFQAMLDKEMLEKTRVGIELCPQRAAAGSPMPIFWQLPSIWGGQWANKNTFASPQASLSNDMNISMLSLYIYIFI